MRRNVPVNYSVKNIIACILEDNQRAKRFTDTEKAQLYRECLEKLRNHPRLKSILTVRHIRDYPINGAHYFARVGVLPPSMVVADQRIKDMWLGFCIAA